MTSTNAENVQTPMLRKTRSIISQIGGMGESKSHAAEATTAVSLEIAEAAELSLNEAETKAGDKSPLKNASIFRGISLGQGVDNEDSEDGEGSEDGSEMSNGGLHLSGILNSLMTQAPSKPSVSEGSSQNKNPLTEDNTAFDEQILHQKVLPDKSNTMFKEKIKHFFILSAAGKPIYSLHGNDEVLMGYMGLITTIISSFQESMDKDVKSISSDSVRIFVKNKYPLYLVAITKLGHEINMGVAEGLGIVEIQLECLYNYILAVLSKSVITKHFEDGMNYDLRRILGAQDALALDTLAMKLTYGFHEINETDVLIDASFYLGSLLENSMRCVRISNACRKRLGEVLLSVKKLRGEADPGFMSSITNGLIPGEGSYIAADLLFGFITLNDKVLSYLRPHNHQLDKRDICTLLFIIQMNSESSKDKNTDLWVPLCMPHFNSSGFVYCYVKNFTVPNCVSPLTIILVSGSKNSFYNMKDAAKSMVENINNSDLLSKRLGPELSHYNGQSLVLRELKVSSIKHFIYKRRKIGQVFVDENPEQTLLSDTTTIQASLQMMYLFTNLVNAKGSENTHPKRLTYKRSIINGTYISGFLLVDDDYEFYCICEGSVTSKTIIDESIRIMKWCDRYKKRIFVIDAVTF